MDQMTSWAKKIGVIVLMLAGCSSYVSAQGTCSDSHILSGYGFSIAGTNIEQHLQYALTGTFEADGRGHFTGNGMQSISGDVSRAVFTGTYHVNADCSGSATFTFEKGATASLYFALVNDGSEIFIIDSDQGTLETGSAKKQFLSRRQDPVPGTKRK